MDPIVSPWTIYLIEVAHASKGVFMAASVILTIALLPLTMAYVVNTADDNEEEADLLGGWGIKIVCLLIVSTCFAIIIPNKTTAYGMVVASKVTPDNLQKMKAEGIEIKDVLKEDIVDVLKELEDGGDTR